MDQLRATPRDSLLDERKVGRAGLPATVLGLLFTPPSYNPPRGAGHNDRVDSTLADHRCSINIVAPLIQSG